MKTLVNIAVFTILSSTIALAQSKHFGGAGAFKLGLQLVDFSELNNRLNENSLPQLSSSHLSFGGGGQFYYDKFIFFGEGGYIGQGESSNENTVVSLNGGYNIFGVGYNLIDLPRGLLYPSIGAGFVGYGLQIRSSDAPDDFNTLISNQTPGTEKTIAYSTPQFQFAINADMFFLGNDNESYGPSLSASIGYRLALDDEGQNVAGNDLINAPTFNGSGIYFVIAFGGGYLNRTPKN